MESPYKWEYVQRGPNAGPVILFLHGFLGSSRDWDKIVSSLSSTYRCLAVDLPGHGKTVVNGASDSYTMPQVAVGLLELLDILEISKSSLAAYSMGGRLALYMAINYPERFEKIVLESASPGLKTATERQERLARDKALADKLRSVPLEDFVREWYEQPLFATLKRQSEQFYDLLKRRLDNDPAELARALVGMSTGAQPSLWDRLSKLNLPLFLIAGEKDAKFNSIVNDMAAICDTAQVEIIADAGHNVHVEQPREFGDIVANFFAEPTAERS